MLVILIIFILATSPQKIGAEYGNNEYNDNRFMLNAVIRQLFEMFRNVIKTGSDEYEVPVMDPYEYDYATLDISNSIIRASANLTNGIVTGLGDYQLHSFAFNKTELSMDFNLSFPMISLYSDDYELEGYLLQVMPIAGKGHIDIEVHDMLVEGKIYLKQSDDEKSILLSHFADMEFTITIIKSRTQFDNNIDGVINAMAEDLLADYLSRFSKVICVRYKDYVIEAINTVLNKFESWYIIAVIL